MLLFWYLFIYVLFVWKVLQTLSVQFSSSVVSDFLQSHELQHARPPCPSPTPRAYSNSCLSCWWCHPTISSSVIPFSSRLQSFPASGSFQMSQFFASGSQIIRVSASASVLPMNIQGWSPLGWTGWISLQSKGLSKSFLQHHSSKAFCHINEQEILPPSVISGPQMSMKAPQIVIQGMLLPPLLHPVTTKGLGVQEARWARRQDWPWWLRSRERSGGSDPKAAPPHTECWIP